MFKSKKVTVTSSTTTVQLFTIRGNINQPALVSVYNAGTATILIGSSVAATCVYPLPKKTSFSFTIIGTEKLYAKLASGTIAIAAYVLYNE